MGTIYNEGRQVVCGQKLTDSLDFDKHSLERLADRCLQPGTLKGFWPFPAA